MDLNASTIEDFVCKNYTNDLIVKELREKHGTTPHISFRCKLIEIGIQLKDGKDGTTFTLD